MTQSFTLASCMQATEFWHTSSYTELDP